MKESKKEDSGDSSSDQMTHQDLEVSIYLDKYLLYKMDWH